MSKAFYLVKNKGFTLIEILVAVALISILAVVVSVSMGQSSATSRDAKRQADLKNLQNAIELYKNRTGLYPLGCAVPAGANGWSGQVGTDYACSDGSGQYITGLAPEYIAVLPVDPKLNSSMTNSGYVYRTNTNRTVYKIMAMNTVESESVSYKHPMQSCYIVPQESNGAIFEYADLNRIDEMGWCARATKAALEPTAAPATTIEQIPNCRMSSTDGSGNDHSDGGNGRFERSYGLWGGFEPLSGGLNKAVHIRNTTAVICK